MAESVTHYFPEALAIFVKGFRPEEIPQESDILVASNLLDTKEISALHVTLTVKNNPGTFNMTIIDTNNKFIVPDDPVTEIANLYQRSNTQAKSVAKAYTIQDQKGKTIVNFVPPPLTGANYYEFKDYATWRGFQWGTLSDPQSTTGYRTAIAYRKDLGGNVVERWAFDADGSLIHVVAPGDTVAEQTFQSATNGRVLPFNVVHPDLSTAVKNFALWKTPNSDFITKYKDTDEQGQNVNTFAHGRCKISPMDRVVIFMSKRFGANGVVNQESRQSMIRVFTGYVNTVQQGYSNSSHTLTVEGEDITKLMRLSVVNVNPSLVSDTALNPEQPQGTPVTVWSDIFKGLRVPQIMQLLLLGGAASGKGGVSNTIAPIDQYIIANEANANNDVEYDPKTNTIVPSRDANGQIIQSTDSKRLYSIRKMLGDLFSKSSVHIIDPFGYNALTGFREEELAMNASYSFYQPEFKTRREIAYKLADDTQFVFYADRNGHIWFHPPHFNTNWFLGAKNPNVFVLDNASIVSYGFIEDDAQVYSSIYVQTDPAFGQTDTADLLTHAAFKDPTVVLKYGQRILIISNPLIRANDQQAIRLYAKSLLQRMLASKYQGQITIMGRAELPPGYPVYIPIRNMVYYVETVEHSLTFGGEFQTTLHLAYGRKPWDVLPEVLTFSSNDEVYMTDGQLAAVTTASPQKQTPPAQQR